GGSARPCAASMSGRSFAQARDRPEPAFADRTVADTRCPRSGRTATAHVRSASSFVAKPRDLVNAIAFEFILSKRPIAALNAPIARVFSYNLRVGFGQSGECRLRIVLR